jgi:hypothetical protein
MDKPAMSFRKWELERSETAAPPKKKYSERIGDV